MKDVMIDLETLGTGPNAAILSIGAVAFDRKMCAGQEVQVFKLNVDLVSAQAAGLTIDGPTVLWWRQQDEGARKALCDPEPAPLGVVLGALSEWLRATLEPGFVVWGNGATFDNVILRSAYRATGIPAPWSHRQDMCYRTLRNLFPEVRAEQVEGKHDSLQDALFQAKHACDIFEFLRTQFAITP